MQYLFGLIVFYVYHVGYEVINIVNYGTFSHRWIGLANEFSQFVSELLLLQNSRLFIGGLNYPLWQVCALLIVGHFIYTVLYHRRKLAEDFLIPGTLLLALTYISNSGVDPFSTQGMFYIPLVRAYIGLATGAMMYRFAVSIYYELIREQLNVISLFVFIAFFARSTEGNLALVFGCFIILSLHDEHSLLNKLLNHSLFKGIS